MHTDRRYGNASGNRAGYGQVLFAQFARRASLLLVSVLMSSQPGCSKGGAPEQDGGGCKKLAELDPMSKDSQLPKQLYAELRGATGASFGLMLDGTGGIYAGQRAFGKCDAADNYIVERVVLVSATGQPLAVARHNPTGYLVEYESGQTMQATGASFTNITTTYSSAASAPSLKVGAVTLSGSNTVKQGDRVSVQISLADELCGIRESKWWLVSEKAPGPGAEPAYEPQVLAGGSGTISLQVPTTLSAGNYVVEGQVTLNNGGRVLRVRRNIDTDKRYKILDPKGGTALDTEAGIVLLTVESNPEGDRVPPTPVAMEATPASVGRCQTVNLSLRIADDKKLPSSQNVKVFLGPAESSKLVSTQLSGGETLTGSLQLPIDAPTGVWYAYPEVVRDALGNEGRGTLSSGKFTLSGNGSTSPPVMAATFIVPSPAASGPDFGSQLVDGGTPPPPDLGAMQLPAALSAITASPSTANKEGDTLTVTVTWNDLKMVLR